MGNLLEPDLESWRPKVSTTHAAQDLFDIVNAILVILLTLSIFGIWKLIELGLILYGFIASYLSGS
jgi:hypothetical protein